MMGMSLERELEKYRQERAHILRLKEEYDVMPEGFSNRLAEIELKTAELEYLIYEEENHGRD